MLRGNSSPVSRRRFASARSSRCSTSFQPMKRQPAVRCCGLSAFCTAVCTNESSSCRSTAVLESRLTCSKLDSTSKKNSAECFGYLLADRVLEGAHVRPVQRLSISREFPLDVAQFDVRPGVARDAAKFRSNVLWRTVQEQEPGCELGVTSARVHVRVDRVDHVRECLLRDPVCRGVGHKLARERWSVRVYSVALLHKPPLMFAASVTVTKAREAKTQAGSAFLVHPRSLAGTMRTAVSSSFRMRSCEILKPPHR